MPILPKSVQLSIDRATRSNESIIEHGKIMESISHNHEVRAASSAVDFLKELKEKQVEDAKLNEEAERRAREYRKKHQSKEVKAASTVVDFKSELSKKNNVQSDNYSFSFDSSRDNYDDGFIHLHTTDNIHFGISMDEIMSHSELEVGYDTKYLFPVNMEMIPQDIVVIDRDDSSNFLRIRNNFLEVKSDSRYGEVVSITREKYEKIMTQFYESVNPTRGRSR